MFRKGKILLLVISVGIVLYGASAVFFGKDAYKELAVFMEVIQKIRDEYVEVPDMGKVQEGAMRGLIGALDPYCSFLTREQYEELQKRGEDATAGAGMVLSTRADVVYVVSVESDGPAAKAGVRPGDYLVSVDGKEVEDMSILEVDHLLRGAPGTVVKLQIFRDSQTKPQDMELTLREPAEALVASEMLDGGVGYLKVESLSPASVEQAKVKLKTLVAAGASKLLLDLRNCADGEVGAGADVANFFLEKGVVYYSRDRQGAKLDEVEASPDKFLTDLPLAVLINGSTAGAAEIVAGALKDHDRASLVGKKSFGVGSAQKTMKLKSGAVLILSTAKYCTPSGKVIQDETARKAGIEPDFDSPDTETRQDLAVESYYDYDEDETRYQMIKGKVEKIQLDKALEVLGGGAAEGLRQAA
ncbi:MAG: PDZ domain-containing protein [Acidobacteriota bacterium]|jgi:carboxyl-terminal processing protease|nr:PDZ domain-containing protein [Acidobacteriota bacterium]